MAFILFLFFFIQALNLNEIGINLQLLEWMAQAVKFLRKLRNLIALCPLFEKESEFKLRTYLKYMIGMILNRFLGEL